MPKRIPSNARSPNFEDRNLIGFFELLLKIDRRVNPQLYVKKTKKKIYDL
jgi:hypothetical protein